MRREVVRGIGFKRIHYISAPEELFSVWEVDGVPFQAAERPLVAKCGKLIPSAEPVVAVVPQGLPTCPDCFAAFVADAQEERQAAEEED